MTTYDGPFTQRRVVPRPDVDLAVFEGGDPDGPVVLLVHGYPDTHRMWRGVAELLADELAVVAYDTRGQGDSVTDAPDEAFTLDVLADDLLAVVDAVSPGRPVHLVGHDWGSIQAWEAVCRPGAEERIASFCAISGPNLAHVSTWVRRTLGRPTPRGVLDLVGQAVSSSYVPFLASPLAPPVLGALGQRNMVSGLRYYRANLGAGYQETPIHHGAELKPGHEVMGPAVIEETFTTIVVYPGWKAEVDDAGDYELTRVAPLQ